MQAKTSWRRTERSKNLQTKLDQITSKNEEAVKQSSEVGMAGALDRIMEFALDAISEIENLDVQVTSLQRDLKAEKAKYEFFIREEFTIIRSSALGTQTEFLDMLRAGWQVISSQALAGSQVEYVLKRVPTDTQKELVDLRTENHELKKSLERFESLQELLAEQLKKEGQ